MIRIPITDEPAGGQRTDWGNVYRSRTRNLVSDLGTLRAGDRELCAADGGG